MIAKLTATHNISVYMTGKIILINYRENGVWSFALICTNITRTHIEDTSYAHYVMGIVLTQTPNLVQWF